MKNTKKTANKLPVPGKVRKGFQILMDFVFVRKSENSIFILL